MRARALAFNLAFHAMTGVLVVTMAPLLAGPPAALFAAARAWAATAQALLRTIAGIRHRVRGRANVPAGPVLVAAKHQSAWETLALFREFARPAHVLKQELTHIPLFGWALRRMEMVAIDRAGGAVALRGMVAAAARARDAGRPVVIFPQGTRTPPGATRPYHAGVAALYRALDVPVVPVALNSGLFWPRRSLAFRPGTITLEYLPPIPPGLPRREFMARLAETIETATARLEEEARAARDESRSGH